MKSSKSKKSSSFYSNIFLTLTLSIVMTILIVSAILYINFDSIVTHQTYKYTMSNLQQTSQGATLMKINTSTLAKQIFVDRHISRLRNYASVELNDVRTAIDQMNYYRATSPFIESIYIYNGISGLFYVSSEFGENNVLSKDTFYDREIIDIIGKYKEYKNLMPIPRWIQTREGQVNVYTFILHDGIGNYPPDSMIIVNYSEKYLYKDVSGISENSGSSIFTIDGDGMVVAGSPEYPMLDNISEMEYIKRIMSDSSAGYFITGINGEKSFVAYTEPDLLGWRYIRVVPYGEITGHIARMRTFTVIAGGVILILGLAVSLVISRKLSTNVDKKLSKLKILEFENRSNLNLKKEEYLRKLLLCEEKQEMDSIGAQFKSLDIQMDIEGWFTVLIIRIDQYGEFIKKYEGNESGLLKFAIMNVAQEILSKQYRVMAIDMNTDRIAVFLNLPADTPDSSVEISGDLIGEVQASVLKYLEISVSVTLSTPSVTAEGLGHLYRQAVEASFYRMFYGCQCIIHTGEIAELETRQYEYPARKEKLLINEFMLGKTEKAMNLVKEIISETANYSYAAFNIAVVHLAYAVCAIRRNSISYAELNINSIFQSLSQAETVEDIYRQFADIFESTASMLSEKKNSKYDELISKTIDLIDREYMNQNLSLESIADTIGMSSTYIGRLFKKHTMKTILDYIVEVRMQKARQFLTSTEFSIGEIAERTGFTNSPYFYKAFKKAHGITPAEYRKSEKTLKGSASGFEESDISRDSI